VSKAEKAGRNIFWIAFLISAAVHVAAYCSVDFWVGRVHSRSGPAETKSGVSLLEIGLFSPPPGPATARPRKKMEEKAEFLPAPSEIELVRNSPEPGPLDSAPAIPEGRAGEAARTTGEEVDRYRDIVRRRIETAMFYPRRAQLARLTGVVRMVFSIGKEGELVRPRIVASSRYPVLDRAALKILQQAAPFPKPEPELAGKEFGARLRFKSTY
jgi:TonB family protein